MAQTGTFGATGASDQVSPRGGDYAYRLNCSAYTSGTVNYSIGFSEDGRVMFYLAGTFVGTVDAQISPDNGTTWVDIPGETYTAPTSKVIG